MCCAERWLVPGAEYAVAKKQPAVNGEVSKEDAHTAAAALLAEDEDGAPNLPLVLVSKLQNVIACWLLCMTAAAAVFIRHDFLILHCQIFHRISLCKRTGDVSQAALS